MSKSESVDTRASRILLVDDDAQLRAMLAELLRMERYEVDTAQDGNSGLKAHREQPADLWVLDVMMPGRDGFETLEILRKESSCPVIMLTARGEPDDRIVGLERGADDYLAKPFNPRELLLRVRAILKRVRQVSSETSGEEDALSVIELGNFSVDPARLHATFDSEELGLTGAELRVLYALLKSHGQAVSREALNQFALSRALTPMDRALDTHVSNLRRKLSQAGAGDALIRSVRGEGYLFVVGGDA